MTCYAYFDIIVLKMLLVIGVLLFAAGSWL